MARSINALAVARQLPPPWISRRDFPAAHTPAESSSPVNTFPNTPLQVMVEIALQYSYALPETSWVWADISKYVRHAPGIDITTGRKDEHSLVEAGTLTLTLDNRDGRFSRRNPASPYYPYLTKNSPIRLSVNAGSGYRYRAKMYVNQWPNRSDRSAQDVIVPLTASGVMRRLGQGSNAKSAIRRTILGTLNPTFYWPLEVGKNIVLAYPAGSVFATTLSPIFAAASAFITMPTGGALQVHDSAFISAETISPGSDSIALFECFASRPGGTPDSASGFSSPSIASVGANGFTVSVVFSGDTAASPTTTAWNILNVNMTGGSISSIQAFAYQATTSHVPNSNFGIDIRLYDLNGLVIGAIANNFGVTTPFDSLPHVLTLTMGQSGGNITCSATADGVPFANNFPATGSGLTLGTPSTLGTGQPWNVSFGGSDAYNNVGTTLAIGHLAVWGPSATPSASSLKNLYAALLGYPGETAATRFNRLCTEEQLPHFCMGTRSMQMGPQQVDSLINLCHDLESVDLGVLYEYGFGLGYQTRAERYNAAVAWNLDFSNGSIADPPAPTDDDLLLRNDWTVTRKSGSVQGATYTAASQVSINAIGLYDESADVNLYADSQIPGAATWRLHLGLVDDERWPAMSVNLASTVGRTLIDQWTALPYGARVNVANPLDTYTPYAVDAFIEGSSEHIEFFAWDVLFNTSPASGFAVYQVGATSKNLGRVDSGTSTVAADPGTAGTSLSVAFTGARWVDSATYPGQFPFDINVGGEQMTVTAITGTSSPQTFTVTRSVNLAVLSHVAGTAVSLWRPSVYAL
jgi:hypothetical protein